MKVMRAFALASAVLCPLAGVAGANAETPDRVKVAYNITLSGVSLGKLTFEMNIRGQQYQVRASGAVRAMFGAFKWDGALAGSGRLAAAGPVPAAYDHTFISKRKILFKTKRKTKTVALKFSGNRIVARKVVPPAKTGGRVPVTAAHLKNTLDPISAVLALTQVSGNPCRHAVEVFDGKTRFRVQLSPKSKTRVRGMANATDFVCTVRYIPIAGHKVGDKETRHMAVSGNISVVFRHYARANLIVPRTVNISTIVGPATVQVSAISVVVADRRIALR